MMKLYTSTTSRFRCKVDNLEGDSLNGCQGQIVVVFGDTIVSIFISTKYIYINYILDIFSKGGFCPML
jgi:hypothetical protein